MLTLMVLNPPFFIRFSTMQDRSPSKYNNIWCYDIEVVYSLNLIIVLFPSICQPKLNLTKIVSWPIFFHDSRFYHFSGTLNTIVALQVINKTSEEYWFIFKIISINAEGENLEKIGNVTRGRSLYFLVKVERTSR